MRIIKLFSPVITIVLIIGCNNPTLDHQQPTSDDDSIRNIMSTPTQQLISPTLLSSPTYLPTIEHNKYKGVSTPTIPPVAGLAIKCLEIKPSLPEEVEIEGVIVLNSRIPPYETYLINIESGITNTLPRGENQFLYDFQVSPDRKKWLISRLRVQNQVLILLKKDY